MTFRREFTSRVVQEGERRSGLNRRWIKSDYQGLERRKGRDRRQEPIPEGPEAGVPEIARPAPEALDELVLANAIRLEALVRLLEKKGLLDSEELAEAADAVRAGLEAIRPDLS
jgi:hypothetical protein